MRADNTRHIVAAAQHRHEYTRQATRRRASSRTAGEPATFDAVASAAGVSRSWLYSQPDLRAEIERLQRAPGQHRAHPCPSGNALHASLLRRLEAANARNRQLADENRRLRDQLARALGEQRSARSREPAKPRADISARQRSARAEQPPEHRQEPC